MREGKREKEKRPSDKWKREKASDSQIISPISILTSLLWMGESAEVWKGQKVGGGAMVAELFCEVNLVVLCRCSISQV